MTSPAEQYGGVSAYIGDLNWWAVEDRAGRTLGCLVLDPHPDKYDGDVVLVSKKRDCSPDQPATKPVGHTAVQPP
jgi:hypothetical protein